uniref:G-protein coupled receptors family 3 profile domain-containing protein n=1 Tax=Cricetulus griseus TaxID=10029 RepID=A0A8C2QN54_CRIGR
FCLLIILIVFQEQISRFPLNTPSSPGYYQDGDFVIGGLFSLQVTQGDTRSRVGFDSTTYIPDYVYIDLTKHFQHMLAIAIETINKDPNILFNLSLGFYLFNVNFIEMKAMESSVALLSGESPPIPNYTCRPEKSDKLVAISYAPYDPSLGARVQSQPPYQFFPVNTTALGELFLSGITEEMANHRLCVAFTGNSLSYTDFGGGLSFSVPMDEILGFKDFLRGVQPGKYPHNTFIQDVWSKLFECPYLDQNFVRNLSRCEQNALHVWDVKTSPPSYRVHAAVCAIVQALREELSLRVEGDSLDKGLHPFFKKGQFGRNPDEENVVNQEDLTTKLDLFNYQSLQNGSKAQVKVGEFVFESRSVHHFSLNDKLITWGEYYSETPFSVCCPSCLLGFRKTPTEGKPYCCFDCLPCPKGEIANKTDLDQCIKCPEYQYPNEQQNQYALGVVLVSLAISLSAFSALILGLFICYRDTPIVRANNRNLGYVLLISLMFCFSCSLIFIGQPRTVTCVLRYVIFGVVFSVAVSAILAKTFTVVVTFKAIKPGSKLQMWMVTQLSNAVVCSGSLIPVCICAVWLGTYPPFPDIDIQSEFGCNEGSTLAFYCVLGYLGFLAVLSLFIAFLARRLPDSFNEAKTITFSMLVFCSVWISFIPAYLSSKGKTMVAVEILSILASSAGLLACICLPKCYVILLRSHDQSRKKFFK